MTKTSPPGSASTRPANTKAVGLAGVIGAGAAALLTLTVTTWEDGPKGPALTPYRDIVGVWTQCSGETKGVTANSPRQTIEGCRVKLDTRLARDFAPQVLACTPSLRGHDYRLAAAISLAYNVGTGAYCRSTVDRRFDAGDIRGACDAFLMWNKAGGRVIRGLDNRRRAERDLCLTGVK